jgi:serine/threonine-protein kinase
MSSDPRVGTVVAGHRIHSVIGRGGMSVVYLAEHLELGRKVALKILGPELAEDDAFRERFIRESRVTAELDHPNIVTVFDAGEAGGLLYISMRFVEGSDLERLLRSTGALEPPVAVDIVSQCAEALDAAHARGLVHRDVKPGNILLASSPDGAGYHAYLTDFGVTKRIDTGANITRTGQFVGTVDYVAPEQIRSDDVDGRADVYSLACVLFRCLTGQVPFPRDTEVGTIYAHLQDPPPVPSLVRPGLPTGFDAPILRALAKDRADRPDPCGAFASALGGVVGSTEPLTSPASSGRGPTGPSRRRRRVMGAISAVAIAAVGAFLILDRPGGGTTPGGSPSPMPELSWTGSRLPTGGAPGGAAAAIRSGSATIVGGRISTDGDQDAQVWRAADGRWVRARSGAFGGAADQRVSALGADGDVVIAVGSESARGDTDAAVWRSTDGGVSWVRVGSVIGGLHRAADQAMLAVIPVPTGWIAAGWDRSGGDMDAAIWMSRDGTSWTLGTAPPFGGDGQQTIAAIAAIGDRIVAVGWTSGPDGDLEAAAWIGTDTQWSRIQDGDLGGPDDQRFLAVAASSDRIVAAGADGGHPALWSSTDGRRWARAAGAGASDGDPAGAIHAVTLSGVGWVAGGWNDMDGARRPAVWRSADGVTWRADPDLPGGADGTDGWIAALVDPGNGSLLAAGSSGPGAVTTWTATAA